ncbi:hypothetical protein Noda2021_00100 [Candidatus Dependentiae bacterium Noda2021]|nr:hypothetical protein Noda2021_00100 [Candidatus Dependentiae bacterium Noda2021]
MLGNQHAAQAVAQELLFNDPLITALHASQLPEGKDKNECIKYSLSNKQSLAAIMAGDKACLEKKFQAACDYYQQAAEFMDAEKNSTLKQWYQDVLSTRAAMLTYHAGDSENAIQKLKALYTSSGFDTIKNDIRYCFDSMVRHDMHIRGLKGFTQCADLNQSSDRLRCIEYLKCCMKKIISDDQRLLLAEIAPAVKTIMSTEIAPAEREVLIRYYDAIKSSYDPKECAQQLYTLLSLDDTHDAATFIKKMEALFVGYKESPDFFTRCCRLITQGISGEQPLSKNQKKILNGYLHQLIQEPLFGVWMEDYSHKKIWEDLYNKVNQTSAQDFTAAPIFNLSALPLEDRIKEIIKGDACNRNRFDDEIMQHLRTLLKSADKMQQEKGLEILFLLSGHEAWLSDSNMQEIHAMLSAIRFNHKSRQPYIDYFIFCMESLITLRDTPRFTESFNNLCTDLIALASNKREQNKKNNHIKCYYEKFIGDLHYMIAINSNKMFLDKKHIAIQTGQVITPDDINLKNQHENCMLAACCAYDLIEKEVQDVVVWQEALIRKAEIAMHYPEIFIKCTGKTPFKSAKDALEKYLKDKPHSLNARFLLASLFADGIEMEIKGNLQPVGKDLGRAIQELTTLRSLKSGYIKLAECLKKQKKDSEVHACYQEGIKETKQPVLYLEYARYLIEKGDYQQAINTLTGLDMLSLESDEVSKKNVYRLMCFFKQKETDLTLLVELLKNIQPSSYQLSTLHFVYKHLKNIENEYLADLHDRLVNHQEQSADNVAALASLGVFNIKLSFCEEQESKAYEQYLKGLKLLEKAAKRSSLMAVEMLAKDPIYSKNRGLREGLITCFGQELLQAPVSHAAEKRKMLFPFKDNLSAQAYLLLYDFTVKNNELDKALINSGCLFMDNGEEYIYEADTIDMELVTLINNAFQLTEPDHMPAEILKQLLPVRTEVKGSKVAQISIKAADQLGRYGIYTFLTRINLAAAKHTHQDIMKETQVDLDDTIKKRQMYLDRAFDSLLDLALMTTHIQPKNHVYRILYFIETMSAISNSMEEHSGVKYYEDIAGLLCNSKDLHERCWSELAFLAGNKMLECSIKDKDPVQQAIAIDYLEIAARNNHDRALDALIEYNSKLIDGAIIKFNMIESIEHLQEISKGLKWLNLGKIKENRIALETLLKYYTRAVNQENNKPDNQKQLDKIKRYSKQLKDVCAIAGPLLTDYIIIKDLDGSKNYEVLYDLETHALMPPTLKIKQNMLLDMLTDKNVKITMKYMILLAFLMSSVNYLHAVKLLPADTPLKAAKLLGEERENHDTFEQNSGALDFIKRHSAKLIISFGLPIAVDLIRNYVFLNAEQRAMIYEQQKQAIAINAMNLENKDVMRQSHQQVLEQQRQQLRKNRLILKDAELKHFYEKKLAIEEAIAHAPKEEKKRLEEMYAEFCAKQARALMGKDSYKDAAAFTVKL